jgi:hypothetical protein
MNQCVRRTVPLISILALALVRLISVSWQQDSGLVITVK